MSGIKFAGFPSSKWHFTVLTYHTGTGRTQSGRTGIPDALSEIHFNARFIVYQRTGASMARRTGANFGLAWHLPGCDIGRRQAIGPVSKLRDIASRLANQAAVSDQSARSLLRRIARSTIRSAGRFRLHGGVISARIKPISLLRSGKLKG
jgi:hypothetical protein